MSTVTSTAPAAALAAPIRTTPDTLRRRELEEALISAVLASPPAFSDVRDDVHWQDFGDKVCRAIAEAIWQCAEQAPPLVVNRPNVIARLQANGTYETLVTPTYLLHLDDHGTAEIVRGALDYARQIATMGRARLLFRAAQTLTSDLAAAPEEVDSLAMAFLENASRAITRSGRLTRDPSAKAIRANRKAGAEQLIATTGIAWLDMSRCVFNAKRCIGVMAPQGGRKTSTSIALALAPVLQGVPVAYFSLVDNSREEIHQQFVAQRATHLMRHWHEQNERNDCGPEHWNLSPDGLPERSFVSKGQALAVQQAESELDASNFSAFDATDGIIELGQLIRQLKLVKARYGRFVAIVDYMQAIEVPGSQSDYETMRPAAKAIHRVVAEQGISAILVSQLNKDETIRGGGDLRDAVAYLLRVHYNSREFPEALGLSMEKGRFSRLNDLTYAVNAPSGAIMNPRKIARLG